MKRLFLAATTVVGHAAPMPPPAQVQKPQVAIKKRQSAMFLQGQHLSRVFAMANGRVPFDAKVMQDNVAVVETFIKLPFVAFIDGTDKGNTRAKPEIWTERAKFDAAALKVQEEVGKLSAAAKSGNIDQIKSAAGGVGQACKACHDSYQKPL